MVQQAVRQYEAQARSKETFGRLCSARTHRFVVDGLAHNGCPGEVITPGRTLSHSLSG